jgi:hypothetical protein
MIRLYDADVLESTPMALPVTWLPVPWEALWVTFDRILCNFRSGDVWGRHFRWKIPTRADIAQLADTLPREPRRGYVTLKVTWPLMTSHPVAMSVMRNGTFCTTTIVRKKRREKIRACTRDHFRSREFEFRLRPVR